MSIDGIPCQDGVGDVQVLRKFEYVLLFLVLLVILTSRPYFIITAG